MSCAWKPNWEETKKHFVDWWNRQGPVIDIGYAKAERPIVEVEYPGRPKDDVQRHTDPHWIAGRQRYALSGRVYWGDTLPIAFPDYGFVSLSLYLGGADPVFQPETIWYEPRIEDPEKWTSLDFDPRNEWYRKHVEIYRKTVEAAKDDFLVGMPGIGQNIEVLRAMRGTEEFMLDLIDRPQWVKERLADINRAFFEAYDGLYDIIKLEDGSSCGSHYGLWGPGKTSLIILDSTAMISTAMFEEFVMPPLREQCAWLDRSMALIDGQECLKIVDPLLEIEALDAVSWTMNPGIPTGEDPCWFDLYRKILKAGKSVQTVVLDPDRVVPLLDEVGSEGMYLILPLLDRPQAEEVLKKTEPFFK
ncbi:MAG: hypothetical protein GY866_16585 [Proteobacteria bacterium]|nr:hypothetical protein [Pseudomonadota bacterium]